jgi:hypothetical protein
MTLVERASCIVSWAVSATCDEAHWQAVLDAAPQGVPYYSDGSPIYLALLYHPGIHLAFPDKSQTTASKATMLSCAIWLRHNPLAHRFPG